MDTSEGVPSRYLVNKGASVARFTSSGFRASLKRCIIKGAKKGETMAKRRTIKEPVTRGKVTVGQARAAASKNYHRSAVTGRYVSKSSKKK